LCVGTDNSIRGISILLKAESELHLNMNRFRVLISTIKHSVFETPNEMYLNEPGMMKMTLRVQNRMESACGSEKNWTEFLTADVLPSLNIG
jgi:hypothetical protein